MAKRSRTEKYFVCVIPHTHWDREWYATFQQFRIRLVHVMDALLDLLERDPSYTHFNLDAQTIVLQDYLEIRPEKRELLQKMVRERRLGVGPWYVLPDEFLVSGEALVHNLLLGRRLGDAFGHTQKVGYIPDTFGHISQLPQILQGFDIPFAMHFRGLDEGDLKSELWWQSPDGSRVLLRHLPVGFGYSNASALADDITAAAFDLQAYARFETKRDGSSVLLALNGSDHLPAREDLPAILETANRLFGDEFQFQQVSLEDYFEVLVKALGNRPLQTVTGELRDANRTPNRDNRLLPNILSSRIYNKIQNAGAQNLLERWAEPWSALAWLEGNDYPGAFLWKAWEWLLQNHPHDSIGGCSIDAVHAQMETRFAWSREIAEEITHENFELLTRKIDFSGLKPDEAALIVFNNLPWPVEEGITVNIDLWKFFLDRVAFDRWNHAAPNGDLPSDAEAPEILRKRFWQQQYGNAPILPDLKFRGLHIRPLEGDDSLPVQIESISRAAVLRPWISGPACERRGTSIRASFVVNLPAFGYQVYAVSPVDHPNKPVIVRHPTNVLENEYLRIRIAANGTFSIEEKTNGQKYGDLGYFEDGGDCGDGYNYSYPLEDRVENTLGSVPRISRLNDGLVNQRYRIDYDLSLPESLNDSRQKRIEKYASCPLSVTLSLKQGSPRLDLQIDFENHARDHRLRMVFPSDVNAQFSQASAPFDVVNHPVKVVPVPDEAWVEDAPTTFPQQDWVDLSDGKRGFCLIVQGLPEYEVMDTDRREVAITLLRAVGYLGAEYEMQTAAVGGGPTIATPEAQIQRKLSFSLSVLPHSGSWNQAEVWRQALAFNNPPRAFTTGMEKNRPALVSGTQLPKRSFLSVTGRNVILSSVKKTEDGEALLLRVYNPSEEKTEAAIQLPFIPVDIRLAGLDESPRPALSAEFLPVLESGGRVRVTLAPKKLVTLRIARKNITY